MDVLVYGTMGNIADVVATSLRGHSLDVEVVPFPQNTFRDEQGYRRELAKALQSFRPHVLMPVGHLLAPARLAHPNADGTLPSTTSRPSSLDSRLSTLDSRLPSPVSSLPSPVSASRPSSLDSRLSSLLSELLIPVDTPAHIQKLDSKVQASALASQLGIPQPRLFASPAEVGDCPVIFKRDSSFGGSGVFRPSTPEALQRLAEREGSRPYLIEEYVEGWDCCVDMLRWKDQFHAACYRTLSRKQGQGPSAHREPCERPDVVMYARRLLDAIDYQGICGMDFRIAATDDKPRFLECNPRFTGGLSTHLSAGFDLPYLWYATTL